MPRGKTWEKEIDELIMKSQQHGARPEEISSLFQYELMDRRNQIARPPQQHNQIEIPSYLYPSTMKKKGSNIISNFIVQGGSLRENPILNRPMPEAAIRSMFNNVTFSGMGLGLNNWWTWTCGANPYAQNSGRLSFKPPLPGQKIPPNPYSIANRHLAKYNTQNFRNKYSEETMSKANRLLEPLGLSIPVIDLEWEPVDAASNPNTSEFMDPLRKRLQKNKNINKEISIESIEKAMSLQWNPIYTSTFYDRIYEYWKKRELDIKHSLATQPPKYKKKEVEDQLLQYSDKEIITTLMKNYQEKKKSLQKIEELDFNDAIMETEDIIQTQVNDFGFNLMDSIDKNINKSEQNWLYLEHKGPVFPLRYHSQNIALKYKNCTVVLNSIQEEAAVAWVRTMFEYPDHVDIPEFKNSFANSFLKFFSAYYTDFSLFDFSEIKTYLLETEYKYSGNDIIRNPSALAAQYPTSYCTEAIINGDKHVLDSKIMGQPMKIYLPKKSQQMFHQFGSIKYRNKPSTTVINISFDAPIPITSEKGESWDLVISESQLDWITAFKDYDNNIESVCFSKSQIPGKPLNLKKTVLENFVKSKDSTDIPENIMKSMLSKRTIKNYEIAYLLGQNILFVRKDYLERLKSKDKIECLWALALYLIDNFGLKWSNDKDKDKEWESIFNLESKHIKFYPKSEIRIKIGDKYRMKSRIDVLAFKLLRLLTEQRKVELINNSRSSQKIFSELDFKTLELYFNLFIKGLKSQHFFIYNSSVKLQKLLNKYRNIYGNDDHESSSIFQNIYKAWDSQEKEKDEPDTWELVKKIIYFSRSIWKVVELIYHDNSLLKLDLIVNKLHDLYSSIKELSKDENQINDIGSYPKNLQPKQKTSDANTKIEQIKEQLNEIEDKIF